MEKDYESSTKKQKYYSNFNEKINFYGFSVSLFFWLGIFLILVAGFLTLLRKLWNL
jgi:hypothetical protein